MMLTAVIILLLSLISGNWLGLIVGGDFLATGLATWKWPQGVKYAIGTCLIILVSSLLFLFESEAMPVHGRYGIIASIAFLAGVFITLSHDRRSLATKGVSDD